MENEAKEHLEKAYGIANSMEEQIMMLEAELRRRISNLRKMREELMKEHLRFWDVYNGEEAKE